MYKCASCQWSPLSAYTGHFCGPHQILFSYKDSEALLFSSDCWMALCVEGISLGRLITYVISMHNV